MLFVLYKLVTGLDMQNNQFLLIRVLVCCVVLFILDTLWLFIGAGYIPGSFIMNNFVNAAYYFMTAFGSYCWFLYSESMQESKLIEGKRNNMLCMIPFIILTILTVTSYWTGWIFYIDDKNQFHRGRYYVIQLILAYGYVVFTAVKALIKTFDKKCYMNRSRNKTLAVFIGYPLVFGTMQTLVPGTPLINLGITLAILNVFVSFQQQLILMDPLTQMNNRNQMVKYLSNKMQNISENNNLYLLIMDIDNFRKINDRYGRIEGDKALIQVANALKYVCIGQNYFTARYGGDEFIIICECANNDEVNKLYYRIQNAITRSNVNSGKPYGLSLSIGIAKYGSDIDTIQDFVNIADIELNKMKQARKKQKNIGE